MYKLFPSFAISSDTVEDILLYFNKHRGQNGADLLVIEVQTV